MEKRVNIKAYIVCACEWLIDRHQKVERMRYDDKLNNRIMRMVEKETVYRRAV